MGLSVAAYAAIATAAISAGAAIHQGQVQSNYRDYQQAQAEADADARAKAAQVEAERIRKQAKAQKSRAIAALASSGVDVDSSTALKINQTIDKNAQEDAFLTIANGDSQAARLRAQGIGYGLLGDQARTAGYLNASNDLLSSVPTVAAGWKTGNASKKKAASAGTNAFVNAGGLQGMGF
ncbi:MAG TPA: hypothetical protein VFK31_09670 [Rhodanobacteraceae bacterium]|nr:hypothetical protein [Rhodanobacteraceae bacterium]